MGNESGKQKKNTSNLNSEDRECISSHLKTVTSDLTLITPQILKKLWDNSFTDDLRKLYMDFLFRNQNAIKLFEFEEFYYHMVVAPHEDRAKILCGILSNDFNSLQLYVTEIIRSYMLLLKLKNPQALNSWSKDEQNDSIHIENVSKFILKEFSAENEKISQDNLESWLRRSPFFNEISDSLIKIGFGMQMKELKPLLPKADKHSVLMKSPYVLLLSHLTRNSMKNWRLLYSSHNDPHSWQIFYNRLLRQGPTLILIKSPEDCIFGGFSSNSWKLCPRFYGDEESFLFSLEKELQIFLPTGYNSNFQYLNSGAATLPSGLAMGGQMNYFGFFLCSEFGPVKVSKSCTTYRDFVQLTPNGEFNFAEVEVWGIGEPDPIEEGVRQVGEGLSMQKDPAAMAILELSGKGSHAKAAGLLEEPPDV